MWKFHRHGIQFHVPVPPCPDQLRQKEVPQDYPIRANLHSCISGENERQAHPVFGKVTEDSTIIPFDMGKTERFLTAIQHREILMNDLG